MLPLPFTDELPRRDPDPVRLVTLQPLGHGTTVLVPVREPLVLIIINDEQAKRFTEAVRQEMADGVKPLLGVPSGERVDGVRAENGVVVQHFEARFATLAIKGVRPSWCVEKPDKEVVVISGNSDQTQGAPGEERWQVAKVPRPAVVRPLWQCLGAHQPFDCADPQVVVEPVAVVEGSSTDECKEGFRRLDQFVVMPL